VQTAPEASDRRPDDGASTLYPSIPVGVVSGGVARRHLPSGPEASGAGTSGDGAGVVSGSEFRAHEGTIDYGTRVVDRKRALLTGHHESGIPDVLVESRDDAVRAWDWERIERLSERADPVEDRV
jgi:hypothetical protein